MITRRALRISEWRTSKRQLLLAGIILAGAASPLKAAPQQVDIQRSTVTVRVYKAGLFRALGDNHEIRGSVKQGTINDTNPIEVHIAVDAASLRVLDPNASPSDRAHVQTRMLGPEVLDVDRFPEIRFDSNAAEQSASGAWVVRGQLTLHGQRRPLTVHVTRDQGHYNGSVTLKQTEFGITPVAVAGGAVKVKDELTIEFDIVTRTGFQPTE